MRGHTIFIWGASSVEVEHSVFVYNHNYSLCVIYLLYLSLSCILAYFYYPVCSLKVLGGGRTTILRGRVFAGWSPMSLEKLSTITMMKEFPFSSTFNGPSVSTDRQVSGDREYK